LNYNKLKQDMIDRKAESNYNSHIPQFQYQYHSQSNTNIAISSKSVKTTGKTLIFILT